MKSSRYVKLILNNKQLFVCNLFSEAVLILNDSALPTVKHILVYPNIDYENAAVNSIKKMLYDGGFLIDDDLDEIGQLRKRFEVSRAGRDNFSIQVAVTLQCNFRCPYCYEDHESISLSRAKQDALIEFVRKNIKNWKRVNLSWFGGEPLLNPEIIDYVASSVLQICEKQGASLEGFITTNGYLLNEKNAEMLQKCHVREAQITIDGDRNTHNSRRFLTNGEGTFDKIVENIFAAKDYFRRFRIRVNVDSQSADNMKQVIDMLEPIKEKVWMAFLPVQKVKGYCSRTVSYEEFRQKVSGLNDLAVLRGFRVSPGHRLPGSTYCGAYNEQYMLLDPRGDVHKCVVMTGKHQYRVGYLADDGCVEFEPGGRKLWNFNPFEDEECLSCSCFPLCMGGCQNFPVKQKTVSGRCSIRDNLERNLLVMIKSGHRENLIGELGY